MVRGEARRRASSSRDQDAATAPGGALLGRVGIVFATPANQLSASKLTVREELAFGLENLGVPRDEMDARIDATLERLAIGHLADREPFALSGGEQQRVAIASIVAMGTSVLVLDEPTAQLDPAGTSSVADLLDELARAGTAILCVEHDPSVIGRMDRLLVLDAGRPIALDVPGAALAAAEARVGRRLRRSFGSRGPPGSHRREAFDEAAIAAGLAGSVVPAPHPAPAADPVAPSSAWAPASGRASVSVAFEDLVHRYPSGIEAVRGVSLTIEPGEAVAILGQNGSGKTTLVKHLNGLLRPASGRVLIDGQPVDERSIADLAATVGFVFQNPDEQLFERSVEREVAFGPRNLKVAGGGHRGARRRAASRPSASPTSARRTPTTSTCRAGSWSRSPGSWRWTRPSSSSTSRRRARTPKGCCGSAPWSTRCGAAGRSVVAITHDMEFAATRFGRIVVMRDGVVVADGPPAVVFAPANATCWPRPA